ncbi:MAG: penicillin-binding transpeptidase domain-containing protein, partial [Actinobacteria bacterium]|nr:penicillin-binding transpeptidase domain-containing protein [Actinomycetota bacterium]
MNQRIRHLTVALIVLFGVLFVQLTNWQVVQRDSLVSNPRNNRITLRDFDTPRGDIITADGSIIAQTLPVDAANGSGKYKYQRNYPKGELFANITGYYTLGYGSTQLERTQTAVLSGKTAQQQLEATGGLFSKDDVSGSVRVTLRADLQAAAKKALGNREGSVVVLDPKNGRVLAMYSNPSYDPNLIASHNGNVVNEALDGLQKDTAKPLLANAYQERYMPGSTFKIVTTTVGLETGKINMMSVFKDERSWVPPNTKKPIRNYGKKVCGGDLAEVFR